MIYITGDTHGKFSRIGNKFFRGEKGDYLIICGDFGGIWDGSKSERYWLRWLSEKPFTVLFIDGNHENYDMLSAFPVTDWNGGKVQMIGSNIIHLMRGQIYDIEGIKFFTMGGASSHDIEDGILEPDDPDFTKKRKRLDKNRAVYRVNHVSWWREELPSTDELAEGLRNLADAKNKVDCILTHCAPDSIVNIIDSGLYKADHLTDYLEQIKQLCDFDLWFFGHYHINKEIGERFIGIYKNILRIDDCLKKVNSRKDTPKQTRWENSSK